MAGSIVARERTRGARGRGRYLAIVVGLTSIAILWVVASALAKGPTGLKVQGAEFDPQRQCDAKAAWIKNVGLFGDDDAFAYGFRMRKLCSTDTNAASFGVISGAKDQTLIGPGSLGFDYKNVNGGFIAHCSAGSPRFNVSMSDGSFHFIGGCGSGTQTPDVPATGWTRVRFDPQNSSQAFPPVPTNATIVSIALVFDEGPEVDPNGSPEIMLDNVFVNGKIATRP